MSIQARVHELQITNTVSHGLVKILESEVPLTGVKFHAKVIHEYRMKTGSTAYRQIKTSFVQDFGVRIFVGDVNGR